MTTSTRTVQPPSLIERVLWVNVVFSVLTGTALLVGSPWLTDLLGPPVWALVVVGAGVVGFGASMAVGLRRDPILTGRIAMVADLLWVAATVGLAPFLARSFTPAGAWTAIAIAVIIADLALLEWIGLRGVKS